MFIEEGILRVKREGDERWGDLAAEMLRRSPGCGGWEEVFKELGTVALKGSLLVPGGRAP